MNNGKISIRYAKALLNFAQQQKAEAAVYTNMQAVCESCAAVAGLQNCLSAPGISDTAKVALLCALTGNKTPHTCTKRFMEFLVEKKREGSIRMIALMFVQLYNEQAGIHPCQLTTAVPADAATIKKIEAFVAALTGGKVEIAQKTDADLIGGFVLDVDGSRMDASIKGQLSKLNNYARH